MLNHSDTKLRSLKLNRRNSVIFAVLMLSLTAIAMPTAAEIVDPAEICMTERRSTTCHLLPLLRWIHLNGCSFRLLHE